MTNPVPWGVLDEKYIRTLGMQQKYDIQDTVFRNSNIFDKKYLNFIIKRTREINFFLDLIPLKKYSVTCDISGGAGGYTLPLSEFSEGFLHCDLDIENLNYVYHRVQEKGIKNVLLIRCDYLQPVIKKESIDLQICMDTLIRGELHEVILLEILYNMISENGFLFADFHNKWNNPLNVLLKRGYVSDNKSYSTSEVKSLLKRLRINSYRLFTFILEFDHSSILYQNCKRLIPATFNIYQY